MRHHRAFLRALVAAAAFGVAAGCTDRLPDQDLRIIETAPVERLSAALLWQDFQTVREQAERNYNGKAIVVTGDVTRAGTEETGETYVYFAQTEAAGVYAGLLAEQAATILAGVQDNPRVRLKCFCEGFSTNVVLKSCVAEP
ncbi:MAG: hypothetical protein IT183_05765 [Acidobacteria bacterium]|nr:hypothetical protein [Acidobacteriota bacterium]